MWGVEFKEVLTDPTLQRAYLAACIITGVVMCFYGYRAFKVVLGVFGVLAGGYVAAVAGLHLSEGSRVVALLSGLVGALLGGVLMVSLYLLAVFVAGAALGALLAGLFTPGLSSGTRAVVVVALALLCGFLALAAQRFLVMVATAFNGAALVVGALWMWSASLSPMAVYNAWFAAGAQGTRVAAAAVGSQKYLLLAAWLLLGTVGAWAQHSPGEPGREDEV